MLVLPNRNRISRIYNIFLGMTGWYRRFIEGYGRIATPLTQLLSFEGQEPSNWQVHVEGSTQNPVMRLPDFSKPFILITDGSGYATGATLAQEFDGFEHPVHYLSKGLNRSQRVHHSYIYGSY